MAALEPGDDDRQMIEIDTGEDQQGGCDAGDGAPPQSSPPEKLRRQHRENEAAPVERPVGPRHPGPQSGAKPFLAQPGGEPAGGMEVGEYQRAGEKQPAEEIDIAFVDMVVKYEPCSQQHRWEEGRVGEAVD